MTTKSELSPSTPECICHKGHLCTKPGCGLYHHSECEVHGNYHAEASTPETRAEASEQWRAPKRIWLQEKNQTATWGFALKQQPSCDKDIEYVRVSTPIDVSQSAREAAEKLHSARLLSIYQSMPQSSADMHAVASIIASVFTQNNSEPETELEKCQHCGGEYEYIHAEGYQFPKGSMCTKCAEAGHVDGFKGKACPMCAGQEQNADQGEKLEDDQGECL